MLSGSVIQFLRETGKCRIKFQIKNWLFVLQKIIKYLDLEYIAFLIEKSTLLKFTELLYSNPIYKLNKCLIGTLNFWGFPDENPSILTPKFELKSVESIY